MLKRVAQPGDLFILLVPTGDELESLRSQQSDLQSRYGGRPVEPIHITVERFSTEDTSFTDQYLDSLRMVLESIKPFPIFGDEIIQFHARYWQQYVLRWRVQQTQKWQGFKENTSLALAELGCPSHFVRERHATCTALFIDSKADLDTNPPGINFPMKLFTVSQVLISQLEGPDQFKLVTTIDLHS